MPIPGPQIHRLLIDGYNAAAANLEQLRARRTQVDGQRDSLEGQRGESLSKLAQHYLPELTPEAIARTWSEVRPMMQEILLRKQHRVAELQADLDADNVLRRGQENALLQLNEAINQAEQRQQSTADEVERTLAASPAFVELSDRAALAEAALERAEGNLDEISQDAARKIPAYEQDHMFCYLRDRGFGTEAYASRGLTRRTDRWLANLIGYQQAAQNYTFLKNTPETMRKIIAEDRAALGTVMSELERMRDQVAKQCDLPQRIDEVQKLQVQRQELLTELAKLSARCEEILNALNEFGSLRCPFYNEAIVAFRGMLAQTDSSDLRRHARDTPEITDDQIVATLRGIESQIDQAEDSVQSQDDSIVVGQEIHAAIGRLIQRFRASDFDAGRCQFSEMLDIPGELDRVRNAQDVDALWDSIRRAQSWGPTTMDKVTAVATHPMTQVLINAMAHAAAGAMSEHARRAGRRSTGRNSW